MPSTSTPPQTKAKVTFETQVQEKVREIIDGIDFENFENMKKRHDVLVRLGVYASKIRPAEYVVDLMMDEVKRVCGDDWIIFKGNIKRWSGK